jgi:ureidoglycolate lyase
MRQLKPEALARAAFQPFGDVVEVEGVAPITINQGFAARFANLARVDVIEGAGEVNISIVTAEPRPRPFAIKLMERHPLGSQIFHPLQDRPWLVLVCEDPRDALSYRAFTASGRQGVNYARNVWHHPLLVLDAQSRFLVVDRQGPGGNLEELWLADDLWLTLAG